MSLMQHKTVFALTVALLALLCSTTLAFAQSGVWTVISSPNQGTKDNQLLGVTSISESSIWAVGNYNAGPYTMSLRTLAEHWNGSSWSIVSTPNPARKKGDYDSLQGVAAVSESDVWAVGYSGNLSVGVDKTLITGAPGVLCPVPTQPRRKTSTAWPLSRPATSGPSARGLAPPDSAP